MVTRASLDWFERNVSEFVECCDEFIAALEEHDLDRANLTTRRQLQLADQLARVHPRFTKIAEHLRAQPAL